MEADHLVDRLVLTMLDLDPGAVVVHDGMLDRKDLDHKDTDLVVDNPAVVDNLGNAVDILHGRVVVDVEELVDPVVEEAAVLVLVEMMVSSVGLRIGEYFLFNYLY